jgi:DNA modification methylase
VSKTTCQKLKIELMWTSALVLDPRNPRKHSDQQIKQIARSIDTFGFNVPILIDRNNNVLAGHGRLLACQKLGRREVPAIRLDLTEAEARAFMIADNRLADLAAWDERLLAGALNDLSELKLDFSIEATGFTMGEIDLRIEGLSTESQEADERADAIPPPGQQIPLSKAGDLWLLRDHRVYCGTALDARSYETLMQGMRAAMVFTDPPYNVPIHGHASGLGAIHHREFAMASGEMNEAEFVSFLALTCALLVCHSVDGSIHFVCTDWRHAGNLIVAGAASYSELKNICVWTKHNAGMGSFYRSQHEFIFVFKAGRGTHQNNIQLGQYGRHRSNVWSYPGANSFSRATDEGHLLALHPTVKPVRLVADAILDCSTRGDVILDSFLGSGTTLIAAERVGRICHGIEIDPLYVDTAIRRWQSYTGDSAVHAVTGKRFGEEAAEVAEMGDG